MKFDDLKDKKAEDLEKYVKIDPDPILREKSKPVENIDEEVKTLAKALKKLSNLEKEGVRTVGMSAIQIGIPLRIAACFNPNSKKTHIMINPKITAESKKQAGYWEACASCGVGEDQLFAKVYRPERITVKYTNLKGEKVKKKAKGFFAHVILHEIDHMNGILFIDLVKKDKIWKLRDLNEYIKEHDDEYPSS